jgi:hypothetical protein
VILGDAHVLEQRTHAVVGAQFEVRHALLAQHLEGAVLALHDADAVDGAQQHGDGDATLAVYLDREEVSVARLKLEPRAAVGNQLGADHAPARGRVRGGGEVHAWRAHELRHDHALCAVDDEGAVAGHDGQVAHEELLLLDLAGFFDAQLDAHAQRRREGRVTVATLGLVVLGLAEPVLAEAELHVLAGEVLDGRDLIEQLAQPKLQELVVRLARHLDEVRHLQHLVVLTVGLHEAGHATVGAHNAPLNGQA